MKQLNFEQSGKPIHETTFVVLDCETTGLAPGQDAITEIAAVKIRGGKEIETFHFLINPERKLSTRISLLTGITDEELTNCPTFSNIAGDLQGFIGNEIIVGHNVAFDINFINASLELSGYNSLKNKSLDTLKLARKIISGEVRNFKLETLARYMRVDEMPTHRALSDVKATIEVLHYLIERSTFMGVKGINDLFSIPTPIRRARFQKKSIASNAPNSPGVYIFVGENSEVLYVGTSQNIRNRINSYFTSDERLRISKMISTAQSLEYIETPTALEARIAEIRILQDIRPEFNTRDIDFPRAYFVSANSMDSAPTFKLYSTLKPIESKLDNYIFGPFISRRSGEIFKDALNYGFGLRSCNYDCKPGKQWVSSPCLDSLKKHNTCFCSGNWDAIEMYRKRYKSKIEQFDIDYSTLTNFFLNKMQSFSKDLKFEKAQLMLEYATTIQKWMNRFELLSQCATLNIESKHSLPEIKNGIVNVRYRVDPKYRVAKELCNIIDSSFNTNISEINRKFICPANELRERFYLATFLDKKNFLNKKLNKYTPTTVARDHRNIKVTTIA